MAPRAADPAREQRAKAKGLAKPDGLDAPWPGPRPDQVCWRTLRWYARTATPQWQAGDTGNRSGPQGIWKESTAKNLRRRFAARP